jgi:hypothetical protein
MNDDDDARIVREINRSYSELAVRYRKLRIRCGLLTLASVLLISWCLYFSVHAWRCLHGSFGPLTRLAFGVWLASLVIQIVCGSGALIVLYFQIRLFRSLRRFSK